MHDEENNENVVKAPIDHDWRASQGLLWHSLSNNRRDWIASDTHLCHVIVELSDGGAVLNTVYATNPTMGFPGLFCGSFVQAARAAAQRSAHQVDANGQVPPGLPAQHLADNTTTPEGDHWYLSTSCYHAMREDDTATAAELHQHCGGSVNHAGDAKAPGTCKRCPAQCVCACHTEERPQ